MDFKELEKRLVSGGRLNDREAAELFKTDDIFSLGKLADSVCRRKNKKLVYFIKNAHISPGNICVNRCRFCAFSRSEGEEGAYALGIEEILARALPYKDRVSELHIVGGLNPAMGLGFYRELFTTLKQAMPGVFIKALTAVEIDYISRLAGISASKTLAALRDAGLDSLPGGGAEIFAGGVRGRLCPEKITGRRWLQIMEAAHKLGIKTNATMLFGHLESTRDRVDHLRRLRTLQDKTGGFLAFIPLPFQPGNTGLSSVRPVSGLDIVRTIAVSRLYLDNFDHIKAYWIMTGEKLAQTCLLFGADDLHGTVMEEEIAHDAGAKSGSAMTVEEIVGMIKKAGRTPVERDTFYGRVRTWK